MLTNSEVDQEEPFDINLLRIPKPTTKYRSCTIGLRLLDALGELVHDKKIAWSLVNKTLLQFDRSIVKVLRNQSVGMVAFKAEKITRYSYVDESWIIALKNVEFRQHHCLTQVNELKIEVFKSHDPVPTIKMPKRKKKQSEQQQRKK